MGQDKTGEAWTGRYGAEKDGMGWGKGWDRKAIKNGMGQGETEKDNTGDIGLTTLDPAQFGLVFGFFELDLLMALIMQFV